MMREEYTVDSFKKLILDDQHPKIILCIGIQASGKTSFAQHVFPDLEQVSMDSLKKRKSEDRLIAQLLQEGKTFIIDNTNASIEERVRYFHFAKAANYPVVGLYFRSCIDESLPRNAERSQDQQVPEVAIFATVAKLQIPSFEEGFDALFYIRLCPEGFCISSWDSLL